MNSIEDLLQSANAAMRAGQLSLAEQQFREILSLNPNQPDALHRLGLIAIQTGRHDAGLQLLKSSVAGPQPNPDYVADLADAYRLLNRFVESIDCCRRALSINPNHATTLNNLAAGFLDQNEPQDAIPFLRRAVQANPQLMQAQYNLGRALLKTGQAKEALQPLTRAIELAPKMANAHLKLAEVQFKLDQPQAALRSAQCAVQLNPTNAAAHFVVGIALGQLNRHTESIVALRQSIKLNPSNAAAWNGLGVSLMEDFQLSDSLRCLDESLQLDPSYPDTHFHRALVLLARGEFEQGWNEYEWRWQVPKFHSPNPHFSQPLWDGRMLPNSTILIHCEQGLGDCIQFARYVSLIAKRVGRVILDCFPSLLPVLASIPGVHQLVARGEPMPDFDVHCPLMSLPRAFATTPGTIPAIVPYLAAPSETARRWNERLTADKNLRVGLVWAAGKLSQSALRRSIPPSALAILASVPNVTFYGLQKEMSTEDFHQDSTPIPLVDLSSDLHDFGETGGIIQNLDLVISADTAVAHLAGAMGKPVFIILCRRLEWKWPLDQPGTPWYPTAELLWQTSLGDWKGVIARVRERLLFQANSKLAK